MGFDRDHRQPEDELVRELARIHELELTRARAVMRRAWEAALDDPQLRPIAHWFEVVLEGETTRVPGRGPRRPLAPSAGRHPEAPVTRPAPAEPAGSDVALRRELDACAALVARAEDLLGAMRRRGDGARLARSSAQLTAQPRGLPEPTQRAIAGESGTPLEDAARLSEEIGADVSHARVVVGAQAAEAAAAVGARAFAVGHRIFFGAGEGPWNERLLKHELAHVVQQLGAPLGAIDQLPITHPDDAVEQEARAVADGAMMSNAGTAEVSIARDTLGEVDAMTYLGMLEAQIAFDVEQRMGSVALVHGSPYLTWKRMATSLAWSAFTFPSGKFVPHMRAFLGDAALKVAVDKGRALGTAPDGKPTDKGPTAYSPNVGLEIANELIKQLQPSLTRLIPRYCHARMQAKLAADDAKRMSTLDDAPEPALLDIPISAPIDQALRPHLVTGLFDFDWRAFRRDNPAEGLLRPKTRKINVVIDQVAPMYFWVTATPLDPKDDPATAEEVSAALCDGWTGHALELVRVGNRFACKRGDILSLGFRLELGRHAGGPGPAFFNGSPNLADPVQGLLTDAKQADALALAQAKGIGTGAQQPELVKRLADSLAILDGVAANAKRLGLGDRLADARARIAQKEKEVKEATPADALKWDIHSSLQHQLLVDLAGAMATIVGYWDGLTDKKSDPTGEKLAADARQPLLAVAEDIVTAVGQTHLTETARATFGALTPRLQSLPFDLMESMLRGVERSLVEINKHDSSKIYHPEELAKRKDALRRKISMKREELLKDPSKIAPILEELFDEVGDLQTETTMVAQMDQLDESMRFMTDKSIWDYAGGHSSMGTGISFGPHTPMGFEVMNDTYPIVSALRAKWTPIYALWKTGDQVSMRNARIQLKALLQDPMYRAALENVMKVTQDIEKARQLYKLCAMVLAMIVITLISMGVGTVIGSAVTGALAGSVAAGTIAASTATIIAGTAAVLSEAAVFTAMNIVFMEDPSWSNIGVEFVFNAVTFGGMKMLSKLYRSAKVVDSALKAGKLAGVVAHGGEMSLQLVAMGAAAIAHHKIAEEFQGKQPSEIEYKRILAESAGMFIAMAIAGRAAAPLFKELEVVGGGLGAKISGMNAERQALFVAALAAKESPSAAKILELVQKDKAELLTELQTLELIAKSQGLIEAAGVKSEVAKAIAGDAEHAVYLTRVFEALGHHATRSAAGEYHCAPAQKETIVAAFGKDAKVEPAGADPVAGTETFKITPPEGKGSSIRLTVGEVKATETRIDAVAAPAPTPSAPVAPTPVELRTQELIAKVRAKGIDPAKLDPSAPEYLQIRPDLIKELGKDGVERFEASLTDRRGSAATKKLEAGAHKVLADSAIDVLKNTLSSCEVMLTGSTTRPPEQLGGVTAIEITVIAPEGVTPEVRLGIDQRANAMTVPASEGVVKAGGPAQLAVRAKVVTREQYLGMKAADPKAGVDLRIDDHGRTPTPDEVAKGFAAAQGQSTAKGELPKDVAELLAKGLPGVVIDPKNPAPAIEAYLNGRKGAKPVKVEKIDDRHYAIKDGDKRVGMFTIYDSVTAMGRELATLATIKAMKLGSLEVTGATDAARSGSKGGAVTSEGVKGEVVKDALDTAGKTTGATRADAMQKLREQAVTTAAAMAELHTRSHGTDKVAVARKNAEIKDLRREWELAKEAQDGKQPQLTADEAAAIEGKLATVEAAFRKAELDTALALGNANVATTGVAQGKVSVDGSAVHEAVGKDGKAVGTGAEDVGAYLASLRTSGTDAGLGPAELLGIEKAFLDAYKARMTTGGAGLDAGIAFFRAKQAIGELVKASRAAKGKPVAEREAAAKAVRDRIEALRRDVGLPSRFDVPADALTIDPAQLRRFEAWLADKSKPLTGGDPKLDADYRARLRDYLARDPRGAIELAKQLYGFDAGTGAQAKPDALLTGDAEQDARRMLDYLAHADPNHNDGKPLTPAQVKEFAEKYRSGERFNPVTRRWYMPGEAGGKSIFALGTHTLAQVWDVLIGKLAQPPLDPPPSHLAPGQKQPDKFQRGFKEWAEMVGLLKKANGKPVADKATLEQRLEKVGWEDKDVGVVRHEVKEPFKDAVVDALADVTPAQLKADPLYKQSAEYDWAADEKGAFEKARFHRMRRALEPLEPGDGGNIAEDWRAKVKGIADPTMRRITVDPEMAKDLGLDANGKAITLDGRNVLDMIEGTKIVDNKDYKGKLGPANEPQLLEQLKLGGRFKGEPVEVEIPVKDADGKRTKATRTIKLFGVRWSATDPRGVIESATWMGEMLRQHDGYLEFEIWNWKGDSKVVDDASVFRDTKALKDWVGVAPALDVTVPGSP
jgi:hypothetical protein